MILTIRRELVHSLHISKWIPFLCTTLERDLHNGRFISTDIVFNNENIHAIFARYHLIFDICQNLFVEFLQLFGFLRFFPAEMKFWRVIRLSFYHTLLVMPWIQKSIQAIFIDLSGPHFVENSFQFAAPLCLIFDWYCIPSCPEICVGSSNKAVSNQDSEYNG